MVVFKEDHFFIRDDRSHICVFAKQLQALFELKSIDVLSCSNSLTSVSLVVMPYTLQSTCSTANPSKVTGRFACGLNALKLCCDGSSSTAMTFPDPLGGCKADVSSI
jgi:hypothetical protein